MQWVWAKYCCIDFWLATSSYLDISEVVIMQAEHMSFFNSLRLTLLSFLPLMLPSPVLSSLLWIRFSSPHSPLSVPTSLPVFALSRVTVPGTASKLLFTPAPDQGPFPPHSFVCACLLQNNFWEKFNNSQFTSVFPNSTTRLAELSNFNNRY